MKKKDVSSMDVIALVRARKATEVKLAEQRQQAAKIDADLCTEIASIDRQIKLMTANLDPVTIAVAESVLEIRGRLDRSGNDGRAVLQAAIDEIACNGGAKLFEWYFGTKDYDRFHGQRSDHPYGQIPAHGHIIFSIGLTVRARSCGPREDGTRRLRKELAEAALYYLMNLDYLESLCTGPVQAGRV